MHRTFVSDAFAWGTFAEEFIVTRPPSEKQVRADDDRL